MNSHSSPLFVAAVAVASSLAACADTSQPKGPCVVPLADSPVRGPADAWVTIVEFADFECPYCGIVVPALDRLETDYAADVRLVWKDFPLSFHEHAFPAAKAGVCAGAQGHFWEMHDYIYAHQTSLPQADFTVWAGGLGLDTAVFAACMTDPATSTRIYADLALGQSSLVSGTPTFFINGSRMVGAQPYADFQAAVEAARSIAQSSGIARADYYATLEATGCSVAD